MITRAWSWNGKGYANLVTKQNKKIRLDFCGGKFYTNDKEITNPDLIDRIRLAILRYLESLDTETRVVEILYDGRRIETVRKTKEAKANCYTYRDVTCYAGMGNSTKTFARLIKILEEEKNCQKSSDTQ